MIKSSFHPRIQLVIAFVVGVMAPIAFADDSKSEAEFAFAKTVYSTFKTKCFSCHGDDKDDIRGEFNMLSREGLLRGGETGQPAIIPGKPEESVLLSAVRWEELEMPPKENDRLSSPQIDAIAVWIKGGAPWLNESQRAELLKGAASGVDGKVSVKTSGGLDTDWTNRGYDPANLWAYQPLWRDESGILSQSTANPIDVLIGERATELNVQLAPRANRRVLIRRATFDLIGLPPTPQEVDSFVGDPADDDEAFRKVIDRLLDSPHYGEQWGRHWLDVVRYADSAGFANDYERGNAWRYRDYVVRSFNTDKPYDEFIREQIAGDEILELAHGKNAKSDAEKLIAVGFLRMGPWELTGMEVPKVARQRFLDDVTDVVGQVFLAHMLQCARCHDHKFDPIPSRDYYAMQSVFATTQIAERPAAFLPSENKEGFDEKKYLIRRKQHYQQTLRQLEKKRTIKAARDWFAETKRDASHFEKAIKDIEKSGKKATLNAVRKRLANRKVDPDLIPPRHVGFEPIDFGMERIARKGIERLAWRLDRYEPVALSVYSGRTPAISSANSPLRMPTNRDVGELEQTCILTGGDPFSPMKDNPVQPAALSVVKEMFDAESGFQFAWDENDVDETVGRRLALANWIASEENPLTARVMANRIWQWHFGRAIAGNPNNFGTTGKKPSYPKLLDMLASQFIDNGWSIKSLHRLIMMSEAYRRSSRHPAPAVLDEKDPNRDSYAVFLPRRLHAEELRDAMLFVSGELNRQLGGIPSRPEMNLEAAMQPRMVMGTFAEAWQPSRLPSQRHRRSIYALRIRGQRDPFLEVFNAPSSDISCEARDKSTVTPQVFAMFNSEITFDRALATAHRVSEQSQQDASTNDESDRRNIVQRLFRLCFGRPAKENEIAVCLEHWTKMTKRHESLRFAPAAYPNEIVRNAVEENTGEKFTFTEPLEFYADFVPDRKASDSSPNLRGLAEVCLVLLNSNEFAYVY